MPQEKPEIPKLKLKEQKLWNVAETDVITVIKHFLIKNNPEDILHKYQSRINSVVGVYLRKLPRHVVTSEGDDLANVAKIEFLESLRTWDPRRREDPWPLALTRMTGAMRDHIRYLTKADPSRIYDWVTSAAHLYTAVNHSSGFEHKIERGVQLSMAISRLTEQEQRIVVWHAKRDRTFKEIGSRIGLSESQVSRIYNQSVKKIKRILQPNN